MTSPREPNPEPPAEPSDAAQEDVTDRGTPAPTVLTRPRRVETPIPAGPRRATTTMATVSRTEPRPLIRPTRPSSPGERAPRTDAPRKVTEPGMPPLGPRLDDTAPSFEGTERGFLRLQLDERSGLARAQSLVPAATPAPEIDDARPPAARADEPAPAADVVIDRRTSAPALAPELSLPLRLRARPPDLYLPRTETLERASALRAEARAPATWVTWTLLGAATLLPTAAGAPWQLITRPVEVTLQAFAALVLLVAVELGPRTERTRARLGVIAGVLLLPFGLLSASATASAFDGPPAFEHLFAGAAPTLAWLAVPGLALAVAGLFLRAPRWLAGTLVGAGLAALVAAALALDLGALLPPDSRFLGDRIAAWATVPLLSAGAVALVVTAAPRLARFSTPCAWALWATALLPLLVLALFAARSDQWMMVLAPLKLVLFLGALTLHLSSAIAAALGALGGRTPDPITRSA